MIVQKKEKMVYVKGLHAVQFGNNWIKKIPLPAVSSNFGCPRNFFHPVISKLDSM